MKAAFVLVAVLACVFESESYGTPDWEQCYSVPNFTHAEPLDVCRGHGEGFLICGGAYNQSTNTDGVGFVMKIDQADPEFPLFLTYLDPFHNQAVANGISRLDSSVNTQYLITGTTNCTSKTSHPFLMIVDDTGQIINCTEISTLNARGIDAFEAENGDYILSCETWDGPANRQCFIARVSGNDMETVEWTWVFKEENQIFPQYPDFLSSRIYPDCVVEIPSSYPLPYAGKIVAGICTDIGTDYPINQFANAVAVVLGSDGTELLREHRGFECYDGN